MDNLFGDIVSEVIKNAKLPDIKLPSFSSEEKSEKGSQEPEKREPEKDAKTNNTEGDKPQEEPNKTGAGTQGSMNQNIIDQITSSAPKDGGTGSEDKTSETNETNEKPGETNVTPESGNVGEEPPVSDESVGSKENDNSQFKEESVNEDNDYDLSEKSIETESNLSEFDLDEISEFDPNEIGDLEEEVEAPSVKGAENVTSSPEPGSVKKDAVKPDDKNKKTEEPETDKEKEEREAREKEEMKKKAMMIALAIAAVLTGSGIAVAIMAYYALNDDKEKEQEKKDTQDFIKNYQKYQAAEKEPLKYTEQEMQELRDKLMASEKKMEGHLEKDLKNPNINKELKTEMQNTLNNLKDKEKDKGVNKANTTEVANSIIKNTKPKILNELNELVTENQKEIDKEIKVREDIPGREERISKDEALNVEIPEMEKGLEKKSVQTEAPKEEEDKKIKKPEESKKNEGEKTEEIKEEEGKSMEVGTKNKLPEEIVNNIQSEIGLGGEQKVKNNGYEPVNKEEDLGLGDLFEDNPGKENKETEAKVDPQKVSEQGLESKDKIEEPAAEKPEIPETMIGGNGLATSGNGGGGGDPETEEEKKSSQERIDNLKANINSNNEKEEEEKKGDNVKPDEKPVEAQDVAPKDQELDVKSDIKTKNPDQKVSEKSGVPKTEPENNKEPEKDKETKDFGSLIPDSTIQKMNNGLGGKNTETKTQETTKTIERVTKKESPEKETHELTAKEKADRMKEYSKTVETRSNNGKNDIKIDDAVVSNKENKFEKLLNDRIKEDLDKTFNKKEISTEDVNVENKTRNNPHPPSVGRG
jgi:hypothetical protein